ncbi:MAG TPA: EamA family transporter RarD [Opitutaceae bacterium]|nr:EamA family transporter RarD [Opitutaceae bacterium]
MSHPTSHPEAARGVVAAWFSYLVWGLAPLFWRELQGVSAFELIAHRTLWSLLLLFVVLLAQRRLGQVRVALSSPRTVAVSFATAALLVGNWLTFVWGVNHGHVVEASLGYFLVPLVNVGCGRLLLGEPLRRAQAIAIGFAAVGVGCLVVQLGHVPWIALALAGTWGGYGLMRKRTTLGATVGLTVETALIAPFALGFLLWRGHTGDGAWGRVSVGTEGWIMATGAITAIPLVTFAYGARRIRLTTLGVLQYITPMVQLALGVLFYHELFPHERLFGFSLIWAALALYTLDSTVRARFASA